MEPGCLGSCPDSASRNCGTLGEVTVSYLLFPLRALGKDSFSFVPSFWWWPSILGIPWLVATSPQSLSPFHRAFFPGASMSVSKFLFMRPPVTGSGPALTPYESFLMCTPSKTPLPNEVSYRYRASNLNGFPPLPSAWVTEVELTLRSLSAPSGPLWAPLSVCSLSHHPH